MVLERPVADRKSGMFTGSAAKAVCSHERPFWQAATEERLRGNDEANSVVRKSRSIEDRLLFIRYRFGVCPDRRLLGAAAA
jgi:hypothetical protein